MTLYLFGQNRANDGRKEERKNGRKKSHLEVAAPPKNRSRTLHLQDIKIFYYVTGSHAILTFFSSIAFSPSRIGINIVSAGMRMLTSDFNHFVIIYVQSQDALPNQAKLPIIMDYIDRKIFTRMLKELTL